ncbi:MAG TPA: 50S ribosomal protein L24e [Candidatus Nanoarchaeia archaeon]|nr:50S ribosomal protein L24e [Candidatus Nanoarchaeia archaeon]
MPTCNFSGEKIPPGTGTMYVKKDGKILWFKNSKCLKNYLKLGRKPVATRWTKFFQNQRGNKVSAEAVETTVENSPDLEDEDESEDKPENKPAKSKPGVKAK